MNRLPVDHSAPDHRATVQWHRIYLTGYLYLSVMGDSQKCIAIDATDKSIVRFTQPRRILGDHIQNPLNIRW